jgi:segregation and condensation protein B
VTDERPDSLAAQAASWVPPWERPAREPDRAYQAATAADADEARRTDDDDDFDEAFEQPDPPSNAPEASAADAPAADGDDDGDDGDVPPELAPFPGESGGSPMVDAPTDLPDEDDEPAPTDVGHIPEVPVPASIEDAAEAADDDEPGSPVDAPLPPDGDDAGDGFDAAPDDDVEDDGEADVPFQEEVPAGDEPEQRARPEEAPGPAIPAQGRRAETRTPEPEPDLDLADDAELRAALESILLVVDEPVAEMQLAQILEQPTERVATMLEDISARYTAAGHGFDLRRAAGGWRLYTRPEYAAYVERFVLDGQSVRLTQAALETLAVVAYKQPVTRSRISAIRGVNCDGVMRTLVTRGLIEECGTESETGAYLYRTTGLFLEKLGLNSVDQLPPLAPFLPDDVEEVLDASG